MYETIRIVGKLRPKYVLWENVKNILSKKHIHNFNAYLEKMEELGYKNFYKVLNAKDYGIPQNRERVFTISIRKDVKESFEFPEAIPLTIKLKDVLESKVDEKYYLSEQAIQGRIATNYQKYKLEENCINDKEIHPTILARYDGAPTLYKESIPIINATKKGYIEALEGDGVNISSRMKYQRGNVQKEMTQTLTTNGGNDRGVVVKNNDIRVVGNYMPSGHEASRIVDTEGIAPTVKENHGTITAIMEENNRNAKHQQDLLQHKENLCRCIPAGTHGSTPHLLKTIVDEQPLRIRKLTPKECWRLMGFDDDDFEKAEKVNSNTQLYKQARE